TVTPPTRTMDLQGGPAGNTQFAKLVIVDQTCQPLREYNIKDLTLFQGAPQLCLGNVIDFRAEQVYGTSGACALGEVPLGANYQTDLRACDFSGIDCCVAVTDTLARLREVDVTSFLGPYAIRCKAVDLSWIGGFVRYASPQTEGIVYFGAGS